MRHRNGHVVAPITVTEQLSGGFSRAATHSLGCALRSAICAILSVRDSSFDAWGTEVLEVSMVTSHPTECLASVIHQPWPKAVYTLIRLFVLHAPSTQGDLNRRLKLTNGMSVTVFRCEGYYGTATRPPDLDT